VRYRKDKMINELKKEFRVKNNRTIYFGIIIIFLIGYFGGTFLFFLHSNPVPPFYHEGDAGCGFGFLNELNSKIDKLIYNIGLDDSYGYCENGVTIREIPSQDLTITNRRNKLNS